MGVKAIGGDLAQGGRLLGRLATLFHPLQKVLDLQGTDKKLARVPRAVSFRPMAGSSVAAAQGEAH